jgi:DNA-directed RNA polymerase specialized sigma24 family protein
VLEQDDPATSEVLRRIGADREQWLSQLTGALVDRYPAQATEWRAAFGIALPGHAQPNGLRSTLQALAAQNGQGRLDALQRVAAACGALVYRAAWSVVTDKALADDAVLATFERAITSDDSVAWENGLASGMARLATTETLALDDDDHDHGAQNESPRSDCAEPGVEATLATLPRELRQAVVLRKVAQLTPTEVAHCLGIEPIEVEVRLQRGLRRLLAGLDLEEAVLAEQRLATSVRFSPAQHEHLVERLSEVKGRPASGIRKSTASERPQADKGNPTHSASAIGTTEASEPPPARRSWLSFGKRSA